MAIEAIVSAVGTPAELRFKEVVVRGLGEALSGDDDLRPGRGPIS